MAIGLGILLLAATSVYLSKETYKKRQINQEIENLKREIDAVEGKNKEIAALINYYKTTEYKERQARSLLGLQKEGEFAVALPQTKSQDRTGDGAAEDKQSNLKKWWNYFFGE